MLQHSIVLLWALALAGLLPSPISTTKIPEYSDFNISPSCHPCLTPHPTAIHWLGYSKAPCFHPGQPVFRWPAKVHAPVPNNQTCHDVSDIHSETISVDEEGLVFAKTRMCFYGEIHSIEYTFTCFGERKRAIFRLGHVLFSKRRREKRWLRRRNPKQGAVHFQQESYTREMLEDSTVGSLVLTVHATHAADQPLFYSMAAPQDTRSQNIFSLDTLSGEIRLSKALDRETLPRHVLKVTAFERLDPAVSASATVIIDVIDVQDNSPVFERESYYADIKEDAPIGTTVLSVFARDLDEGPNGEVVYSIGDGEGSDLITVDAKSGVVQTATVLDRETLSLIRLKVMASDKGDPPRVSTALIEINVVDVNDNAPKFEQDVYNVTVLENVSVPVVIARLVATDPDSGTSGQVNYGMVTSSDVVHVDYRTGEVSLRKVIDARSSPLTFLVRAKDGAQPALTSTVSLIVNILDINDHAPRFIAAQKQITLEETLPAGNEIGRVYAIDEDSGDNGRVVYLLQGSEDFTINSETGVITTVNPMDREKNDKYTLNVTACDGAPDPLCTSSSVDIIVKDVNDNIPIFEPNEYNLTLSEEMPRGSQILKLKAIDKDEDPRVSYKIEHMDKDLIALIDLGEQGALLTLSGSLTAVHEVVKVVVSATDQGGLKGICTIYLQVDDVNSPPVFLSQPLAARIPEDSPIGFPVITVKAEDHDRGENAEVTYSIESDSFKIDNRTGQITVAVPLDREEQSGHTITVVATDGASPPLSTSTTLEVILDDVNDNAPEFTSQNYTKTISEDIAIGTSFLLVSAVDFDSGPNGLVDYFVNDSAPEDLRALFRMDRTSGTIRVNQALDREKMDKIVLPIVARDRGVPSMSSSSTVTIFLQDVNDNAPSFSSPSYDLWIAENSPVGTRVGTLVATDPDQGENAQISFRIFGGADAKLFDIEVDDKQPGVVHLMSRSSFDYESKSNKFVVEVQASSGQLSCTVPVRVHVSDMNDNSPQLRNFTLLVNHVEGEQFFPSQIGQVPAFDPDQNATLEYSIEDNELLTVDRYSGQISLRNVWKRHITASFKTCVSDGVNAVCSFCQLLYQFIDSSTMSQAVTVQVVDVTTDEFLDPPVFQRFRESIAAVATWKPEDVRVLGIQEKNQTISVSLAIGDRGRLESYWSVSTSLSSSAPLLAKLFRWSIKLVRSEACRDEPCPFYQKCTDTLKYVGDGQVHQTDNFIGRTLNTLHTFSCECPNGFSSSVDFPDQCNIRLDQCYSNPCRNNGTCRPLEEGYRCECAPGWRGKNCELSQRVWTCLPGYCKSGSQCELNNGRMLCTACPLNEHDTDERCTLRSVSFDGNGLVNLNKNPSRIQWSLEFRISTITRSGTVVWIGDKNADFFDLYLHSGILRAEFSVGGKKATVKMDRHKGNRIDDGHWHTIRVEYYERSITIIRDHCDPFVTLNAPGAEPCAAKTSIQLPAKCLDATVPCHRFFDVHTGIVIGGRPLGNKKVENGFKGCLSNISYDGELIDFSGLNLMEKIGIVKEGCPAKRNFCSEKPCGQGATCLNRWMGHNCRCPHSAHHTGDCPTASARSRAVTLFEEESFTSWKVPVDVSALPLQLSFEYRTSRDDTQIIVAEFDKRNIYYVLALEDGLVKVTLGLKSALIPCPDTSRGHWTRVEVEFTPDGVTTIVDAIYSVSLPLPSDEVSMSSIYSGLAPSTSHPARYEGCLRDVEINGKDLKVDIQGKVRQGCVSTHGCQMGSCPQHSTCKKEFNSHKCDCDPGFAGDSCVSVCSLSGVCGSDGACHRTNSSIGYECQCANGFSGANCLLRAPTQECPPGWWGLFGECRQCNCSPHKGFAYQCDRNTGECVCPKFYYLSGGSCVPCECGLGSSSLECSGNGQCTCAGQAAGRRCDRCPTNNQVLDAKSLKCLSIRDRCPSQIEYGIQWPTTVRGAIARQSCPYTEVGLATRACSKEGKWMEVNNYNCTRPEYTNVIAKLGATSPSEVVSAVYNATTISDTVRGRNLEIGRSVIERLLEGEIRAGGTRMTHLIDESFTVKLIESAAVILPRESPLEYDLLASRLNAYGYELLQLHEQMPFLNPFAVQTDSILFLIDRLNSPSSLPKWNNIVKRLPESFPSVQVNVAGEDVNSVFIMVLPNAKCIRCAHPVVAVMANTSEPITVEFPLEESSGWRYPECVLFSLHSRDHWTADGAELIGVNATHVTCQYKETGMYTVLLQVDQGVVMRISSHGSIASPISAAIALLICALSILCTIFRRGIRTKFVRVGFIVFFICHATNAYFAHKVAVNQIFCPVRNAILSFCATTPFAWLFLYSLHIYRMLADGNPATSAAVCLSVGLVLPCLLSSGTFLLTSDCSLHPSAWLFWTIAIPVVIFLLLSFYASATSYLISGDKQYDVIVVKFSLRRTLLQHLLLTIATLLYTGCAILLPLSSLPQPFTEIATNTTLVIAALYILVWSCSVSRSQSQNAQLHSMWMDQSARKSGVLDSTTEPHCDSPLIPHDDPAGWMPDVIPAHPTHLALSRAENPLANTILSPASKILQTSVDRDYDAMSTLPRFTRYEDQMDDVYYTYTKRKQPTSTFGNDQ